MLEDNLRSFEKSITIEKIPAELESRVFVKYIQETDHAYATAQRGLCFAVIARIYGRVLKEYYFGDIKVDGNMIIDGNQVYSL